ncbi:hypothetical protein ASE17_04555 [Phenylobacterium sp. Root77]|jgi:uncharacterized membrane protein YgdD (TMEM256/DUF423 family)|uniref:DUF423 domain-containing protein n=1 Tax=unclassified Phenylobacterium TaxID=2640670 RepID=UPI0006FA1C74|nr:MULTISPECIES: DUF423 domain-containing protein [unclassified Phenylobacterium]KQW72142.1 hypothetical protein ASC73_08780 [Phenylobacterium sp. Root1277]KQW95062.1 hypothetical protein ASC79_04925 [Phenylobacterium sp. Root1290]KRC44755.1 hypothetical protein ASE17_04555 [Phenylobacterium sp. Root77]
MSNLRAWTSAAAICGFLAVAFGAFAAHGVTDPKAKEWMHTGATYAFLHALAVFAAVSVVKAGGRLARVTPPLFLAGVVIFSGSLFAMALGAPRWFGAITPIGGTLFLIGWAVLAWAALQKPQD